MKKRERANKKEKKEQKELEEEKYVRNEDAEDEDGDVLEGGSAEEEGEGGGIDSIDEEELDHLAEELGSSLPYP
jgi:hypothetical protein